MSLKFWEMKKWDYIDLIDEMLKLTNTLDENKENHEIEENINQLIWRFSSLNENSTYDDFLVIKSDFNKWLSYEDSIDLKKDLETFLYIMEWGDFKQYSDNKELRKELEENYVEFSDYEEIVDTLVDKINELIDIKEKKEKEFFRKFLENKKIYGNLRN